MNLLQITILAVIQGLTEFLPISSSGHLVIMQKIFGFSSVPLAFDVLLHLGSLLAIVIFFKSQLENLLLNWRKNRRTLFLIFLGSLPAAFFGFLFREKIELIFNSLEILGACFLITAIILFSTKLVKKNRQKKIEEMTVIDSLKIGMAQALAIFPGISRSGSTIVLGLWSGLSFASAFTFSFLLALPAISGAALLELTKMADQSGSWQLGAVGMAISAIVSYFTLKFLKKVLEDGKYFLFGWYCLFLGIFLLFL